MQNRIFSFDDNAKAAKAAAYGYLNAIHYLAPADVDRQCAAEIFAKARAARAAREATRVNGRLP